ncbi:MAG: DNA starvation/stationary phase protection protein [Flavobacteriia bacterium]|nr:DNA starvation/stationary phase protection protein [Flavobacteriia bacterium]
MTTSENMIGLNESESNDLGAKLNQLLANFQIHYQNLRAVHWNIRGRDFFELHVKFEEYYTEAQESVDEIAERILTLESVPMHTYQDYIDNSSIPVAKNIFTGEESVQMIVNDLKTLIKLERELISLAGEHGDEGTIDMLSTYVASQEKHVWMLNAWLGKPKV